jgi:hypothetical protein
MGHFKDSGKIINPTAMEYKLGRMEVNTKVIIKMVKSMVKEPIYGQIDRCIKDSGIKEKFLAKELINIKMVDNTKDFLFKIKCTEKGFILGQMEENILENIKMTRNKDLEDIIGLMEDFMKANGEKVAEVDMVKLFIQTAL